MESAILTVLFIAAPIGLAVVLGRYIAGVVRNTIHNAIHGMSRSLEVGGRTAREILDERYARGEIGREEYERIRRDLAS